MDKKDVEFLKELQHEMNTQDTICQADPRFWVVMQTVRYYWVDDDIDGIAIFDTDAAENLSDIAKNSIANGFHELEGDRKREYAVNLVHPFRLVFIADQEHINEDSHINIKCIRIEEVVDYHGKNKRK